MSITRLHRLKSRKSIEQLIAQGRRMNANPLRLIYRLDHESADLGYRVTVSVPKRLFPRAVDRNRIKRQIKECWRKHAEQLNKDLIGRKDSIDVLIVYGRSESPAFTRLEAKIILLLNRLEQQILIPSDR